MIELEALERLKPCPFCGSNNYAFLKFLKSKQEVVQCDSCEAMGPRYLGHHKEAWNTRADPKPLPWLRAEEVTPGPYWWWTGRKEDAPVMCRVSRPLNTLYVYFDSSDNDAPCPMAKVASIEGQYRRIPEPELPKEESE